MAITFSLKWASGNAVGKSIRFMNGHFSVSVVPRVAMIIQLMTLWSIALTV